MEKKCKKLLEERNSIPHLKMQCKITMDLLKTLSTFIWMNDLPIELDLKYKLEHPFGQILFEDLGGIKLNQ